MARHCSVPNCGGYAIRGSDFCYFHTDRKKVSERKQEREEAKAKRVSIVEFMQCFKIFKDKSWDNWRTFLKVISGEEISFYEKKFFSKYTEREKLPHEISEIYAICGRRSGKSIISSLIAVYNALYHPHIEKLAPGEIGSILVIATDKKQAQIILNYCKGFLDELGFEKELRVLAEEIFLPNNVQIMVKPPTFRGTRGFTNLLLLLDELAFFRSEESANPCEELITSLLPGLVPEGMLIGISTPYARSGYLFSIYQDFYGKENENVLVWKAPSLIMNPTLNEKHIEKLCRKGKAIQSEFDATWREDIESYLTLEEIERIMTIENSALNQGKRYSAFCDLSGGKGCDIALAIGHLEDGVCVVDYAEATSPPFDTGERIEHFVEVLNRFGISEITGDRWAGAWPLNQFKKLGIVYKQSAFVKNDIFLEFQSLAKMGVVKIPKIEKLKVELSQLERRPGRQGKDVIEHYTSDDLSNAVAGCAVLLKVGQTYWNEDEVKAHLPVFPPKREKENIEEEMRKFCGGAIIYKKPQRSWWTGYEGKE